MKTLIFVAIGIALFIAFRRLTSASGSASPAVKDPVAEAKIYLSYGRKDDAVKLLQAHLQKNPQDLKARNMLESIK